MVVVVNLRRSVADRAFRELQGGVTSLNPGFEHPDFPKVLQDQLKAHRYDIVCTATRLTERLHSRIRILNA